MKHDIDDNGGLTFIVEDEADREALQDIRARVQHLDHGFLAEMLEYFGYSGNGVFEAVTPEEVGGLTDAPMLADELHYSDEGARVVTGKVWWYPDYESKCFADILINTGRVTFNRAL